MVRWLAVGLLLVTTTPALQAQMKRGVLYIHDEPLVGSAHLWVKEEDGQLWVQVSSEHTRSDQKTPEVALQAWALKSDGTLLQTRDPSNGPIFWRVDRLWLTRFAFERATPPEFVAVVVSVNGALFVRAIPKGDQMKAPLGPYLYDGHP